MSEQPVDSARIVELEAELRHAHNALRCILAYARGPVAIPAEWLRDAEQKQPLMQVDTAPDGSETWTIEESSWPGRER